jgi:hypothetical protein
MTIDWTTYAQSEWNSADIFAEAVAAVRNAHDDESGRIACQELMRAAANNHAGTYWPVMVPMMDVCAEAIAHGSTWSKRAVLAFLDDIFASFAPEPGFEVVESAGERVPLRDIIQRKYFELVPALSELVAGNAECAPIASDLLAAIRAAQAAQPIGVLNRQPPTSA